MHVRVRSLVFKFFQVRGGTVRESWQRTRRGREPGGEPSALHLSVQSVGRERIWGRRRKWPQDGKVPRHGEQEWRSSREVLDAESGDWGGEFGKV